MDINNQRAAAIARVVLGLAALFAAAGLSMLLVVPLIGFVELSGAIGTFVWPVVIVVCFSWLNLWAVRNTSWIADIVRSMQETLQALREAIVGIMHPRVQGIVRWLIAPHPMFDTALAILVLIGIGLTPQIGRMLVAIVDGGLIFYGLIVMSVVIGTDLTEGWKFMPVRRIAIGTIIAVVALLATPIIATMGVLYIDGIDAGFPVFARYLSVTMPAVITAWIGYLVAYITMIAVWKSPLR